MNIETYPACPMQSTVYTGQAGYVVLFNPYLQPDGTSPHEAGNSRYIREHWRLWETIEKRH